MRSGHAEFLKEARQVTSLGHRGSRALFMLPVIAMFMSAAEAEPMRKLDRFKTAGREVRVETFADPANKNAPSIIVLHGATGVDFANRFIASLAERFAAQGFVVHLVHYFDRTGTRYADDETIKDSSTAWLEAIHEAVSIVRKKRPDAAIGFFGYSLGGYLSAAESIRNDEVSAAVILAGGLDEGSARSIRRAPPMLILHGAADRRVPVSEARRLESALKSAGGAPELHVYPGEGHIMSLSTYADVVQRSLRFFRGQLRRNSR